MYQLALEQGRAATAGAAAWRRREAHLQWVVEQYGGVVVVRYARSRGTVLRSFESAHAAELFMEAAEAEGYSVATRAGRE